MGNFFIESDRFSEIGGHLKQGMKRIIASGGMDAPDCKLYRLLAFLVVNNFILQAECNSRVVRESYFQSKDAGIR